MNLSQLLSINIKLQKKWSFARRRERSNIGSRRVSLMWRKALYSELCIYPKILSNFLAWKLKKQGPGIFWLPIPALWNTQSYSWTPIKKRNNLQAQQKQQKKKGYSPAEYRGKNRVPPVDKLDKMQCLNVNGLGSQVDCPPINCTDQSDAIRALWQGFWG